MKRLNKWLSETFRQWDFDTEEEGCYVLWVALISFLTLIAGHYVFRLVGVLFPILCLGLTVLPPILLGIKAFVKKERFNPLYWFLGILGLAMGGLLACLVDFVVKGFVFIINVLFF